MRACGLILLMAILPAAFPAAATGDVLEERRADLVAQIRSWAEADPPAGKQGFEEKVLGAINDVERHKFVPDHLLRQAYANHPLPIGYGQTISQPYIVALMTDLLEPQPTDIALEVGTGSGYQAAVLAGLVAEVYSIEIIEPLAVQGRERLERLGYDNVETRIGDGYYGWEEQAPFDLIIVTAAASHVPPPLIKQLKPGGRMVIPVGGRFTVQHLLLIEKAVDGSVLTRQITAVRFVPLTGDH